MRIPNGRRPRTAPVLAGTVLTALLASGCGDSGSENHNNLGNQNHRLCGDGILDSGEACDNGPENSDVAPDACRTDCTAPRCGDGARDSGEACDQGPENSDVAPDACRTDCTAPRCGDGTVDPDAGESCDCGADEASRPGRCARANTDEPGPYCPTDCGLPRCGDGVAEGPEQCDGEDLGGAVCADLGLWEGTLACNGLCRWDPSGCSGSCGDGIVSGPEPCDGGEPPALACTDLGYEAGHLGCTGYCTPTLGGCQRLGWTPVALPESGAFAAVWGPAPDDLWILGAEGRIQRRQGPAWSVLDAAPLLGGRQVVSLWGPDGDDVWIVGEAGTVLRHGPAGFRLEPTSVTEDLLGIWGSAPDDVFAVGMAGTILHHDGTGFSVQASGTVQALRATWGAGPGEVFAVGDGGTMLRFDGTQWTAMASPTTEDLLALAGRSASDVWAVGGSGTVIHHDGVEWTAIPTDATAILTAVWAPPGNAVYVTADDETLRRWDGRTWIRMTVNRDPAAAPRRLRGLVGFSERDVYAVGDDGAAYGFDGLDLVDSGLVGSGVITGDQFWSSDLWGSESDDVFLAGAEYYDSLGYSHARIFHSDGRIWSSMALPVPTAEKAVYSIRGFAPDSIFAVAGDAVLEFDGQAWSVFAQLGDTLTVIRGTGPDALMVVGWDNVYRWTGAAWEDISIPGGSEVFDLLYLSADDAWVVGMNEYIAHWNGTDWQVLHEVPEGPALVSIWRAASGDLFAAGPSGAFLHFDGTSWVSVLPGATNNFRKILPGGPSEALALGSGSEVEPWAYHYSGSQWVPLLPPIWDQWTGLLRNTALRVNAAWGTPEIGYFLGGTDYETGIPIVARLLLLPEP